VSVTNPLLHIFRGIYKQNKNIWIFVVFLNHDFSYTFGILKIKTSVNFKSNSLHLLLVPFFLCLESQNDRNTYKFCTHMLMHAHSHSFSLFVSGHGCKVNIQICYNKTGCEDVNYVLEYRGNRMWGCELFFGVQILSVLNLSDLISVLHHHHVSNCWLINNIS
jgi:hypothetical protein